MRRVGILVAALATLAALLVYLGDRRHSGGEARQPAPPIPVGVRPAGAAGKITLLAQEQGMYGAWTTKRRLSVSCAARPSVLCQALRYYASHRPTPPCIVHGGIGRSTRVVISGQLGGRSVTLKMGVVCNPPPALSHAVQAIYLTAFRPVRLRQLIGPGPIAPPRSTSATTTGLSPIYSHLRLVAS